MASEGVAMKYDKIHKVLGEGNFVLTISKGLFADKHTLHFMTFSELKMEKLKNIGMSLKPLFQKVNGKTKTENSEKSPAHNIV